MKLFIVCSIVVMLAAGCSTAMKADSKISATIDQMNTNMSVDCRAGLANGLASASKIDQELQLAVAAITKYANQESEDWKKCYVAGAWATFSAHGTADLIGKIITEIGATPVKAATTVAK